MSLGSTFDVTQAVPLALDVGVSIVGETYSPNSLLYGQIADVVSVAATSHPFYGDKSTTLLTDAEPRERADGQEIDAGGAQSGYTPQGKIVPFARKLAIPERVILAAGGNARNQVGSMTAEFVRTFTQQWMNLKNKKFAEFLTNGAKTAGNAAIYDGSFPGNADPYPKFIYDGKPLFATDHPIYLGSGTYANHATGSALGSTTFDSARTIMTATNAVDEKGEQIMLGLGYLVVPPALEGTARTILESQNLPGGANNDVNFNRGAAQLVVNPFLTDTDGWFLFADVPTIRVMDSGEPNVRTWFDEETRCVVVSCEGHFGLYARDWRGVLARNLATS